MRLIDADALLENYNLKDATKYGNKDAQQQYHSYSTLMLYEIADMIEDAPTAYDVEKVVEKLDKASDYYECEEQGREHVQMVDLSEAIEIVKGGGVNGYVSQEQSNDFGNKKRG